MNTGLTMISCALVCSFGLSACNEGTDEVLMVSDPNIQHHAQSTVVNTNPRARLVLGSQDLLGQIAIVDVRLGTVGALNRAEVSVQNLSYDRYSLEYRVAWEDQQGFSINDNTTWHRFTLAPREIKSFQSVGKTPEAYALTFTVRLPDDLYIQQEKMLQQERMYEK